MAGERFLGVTVMPEYVQNEGIDAVLHHLERMGATAVATSPYVMVAADAHTGSREPPDDAGAGNVRLLDRPLWGKHELFVRTAPAFTPNPGFYKDLVYQPPPVSELTFKQGPIVHDFIAAAKREGMKVYLQIQAAIPPGYRVQFGGPIEADQPRLPDGSVLTRRLAKNGSLASPSIRAYTEALIRDLVFAYPDIDGIRVDWPEDPPYLFDDIFVDFSEHARACARRLGFDFERMRQDVASLYQFFHGKITNAHLQAWLEEDGGRYHLIRQLANFPGVSDWLRFKAVVVEELLEGFRQALTQAGGDKELMPNAFPPPFSIVSGMDYARVARLCSAISVKLYTMHWPMILRFYGEAILQANRDIDENLLVNCLVRWLDIADDDGLPSLADYAYPQPDQVHPVGLKAQERKLRQAQRDAGQTPILALVHPYGRADDFRRRLQIVAEVARHGLWINRYGYLSEEKMQIVADVLRTRS
ncbi:MAG: hypothetical protein KatS3mg105_0362 [Gemmatales bacterium]|nr:MAG: hypothetical protein KatS3mg105_0362 [Gemmatales bacterium]